MGIGLTRIPIKLFLKINFINNNIYNNKLSNIIFCKIIK